MTVSTELSPNAPQEEQLSSLDIATRAMTSAIEQKSQDVVGLGLELSDVAEYFVIASGTSAVHVRGIADKIKRELRAVGEKPIAIDGYEVADWVLLDYGNVVVHVFFEPIRQFYGLDELWGGAARIELSDELEEEAKKLRTGMF